MLKFTRSRQQIVRQQQFWLLIHIADRDIMTLEPVCTACTRGGITSDCDSTFHD
jgi:hypothetical protein